jgi:hypothetical protein
VDKLHGDHFFRAKLPVHGRYADNGIAGKIFFETFDVPAFHVEVELVINVDCEFLHDTGRVQQGELGDVALGQMSEVSEDFEIDFDDIVDKGTLDFHRHFLPGKENRAVNLRDRCRRFGDVVEFAEYFFKGPGKLIDDNFLCLGNSEGRDLILSICPNFMKVGPSSSRTSRIRMAKGFSMFSRTTFSEGLRKRKGRRIPMRSRLRISANPYFMSIERISLRRRTLVLFFIIV